MNAVGFTVFPTAIGACALAWGPAGIVGVWLPESDAAATQARVLRRWPQARPSAVPPTVRRAVQGITALLEGGSDDLQDVALDLSRTPAFHRRVYEVARAIVPGRTLTYGEVAQQLGEPGAARAVGQALGRNPFPIVVPCHRVLAAGGQAGGFSAPGGVGTKFRLLQIEGGLTNGQPQLF
ncbi:methylated-DNA--[protein]-cysteine S-methyltransferase [Ideonella sp. BN130291]|uniref:methylated-DNA--[protein]-cysteine S-methyltransferase n=1 Tax=Ideonella sp. BN130291 TaxID=3112940 RepID=UPI002E26434E|nr:methylated-DNA--[protein]-cysteine S-methyltransferase [Ideonella sp. BN130291]